MNKTILLLIAVALPVSASADDAKHDMDHHGGASMNHAEMHRDQGAQHDHDADHHDMAMKVATITHTDEISAALADGGAPVVVDVLGVVCDFCATAMNKVFSKRNEVAAIYVDLDKKTLSLVINDGSDLSDKQIESLAKQAGYRIAAIRRDSEAMGG
ncbi:MAG: cation transporter [Pseudomonadota bacterium]|nr:cation transporter [Pseudomonadota bacterium]